MKTSLFYKSHQPDFPWLEYSRDSVRKFVTGFDEIVLCLPEGQTFDWPEAKIVHVREHFNPYGWQQLAKLYADTWCTGDVITFQDSDTVWSKPVRPSDLFMEGKPFWPIRPFGDARADQQIWRDVIRKYMKEEPIYEGMARHPFCIWRKSLAKLRAHCELTHDCSLGEYIERQFIGTSGAALNFSEWNILSAFCRKYMADDYRWIDLSKEQAPEAVCWQGFSHGPPERLQQDIAKFKEILGEWKPVSETEDWSSEAAHKPLNFGELEKEFPCRYQTPLETALAILSAEAAKSPLHKARLTKKIQAMGKKPEKAKSKKRGPNKTGTYQDLVDGLNEHAALKANKKACPKCQESGMVQLYPVPVKCDCGAIYKPVQPKKKRGRPAKKKLPGTGGNSVAFGDTSPEAIEIAARNIIVGTRPG